MVKISKILATLLLIFTTSTLFGQEFIWDVRFASQFDNREYNTTLTNSQTLFGARLTPQIGIGWGRNSLNIGTDIMADFGAPTLFTDPTLLLYYAYNSKKFDAYMGVFPRTKMIGNYSSLFFSGKTKFYDPNLDGFMLQYTGNKGSVELGIDWCGLSHGAARERFMIFSAGEVETKMFFAGYNATIFHFAASEEVTGVVDNVLFYPYVGLNISEHLPLDILKLQVGWVQGLHKDRSYESDFNMCEGVQIDVHAEKWNIGIENMLYIGENQLPYNNEYGSDLYFGSPYYSTESGIYNRFEIYWHPFRGKLFDLKISSRHHYDGYVWGWQQLLTLNININKGSFKNRVKYINN